MEHRQFATLFEALCSVFRAEPTEALVLAYWLSCKDLEPAAFERAVMRAMSELDQLPKPVELRRLAGEQSEDERAIAAWARVRAIAGSVGAYSSIDFEDPAINAAVRTMGGWPRLCRLEGEDYDVWAAKEFQKQYRAWSGMRVTDQHEQAAPLPGLTEQSNAPKGHGWPLVRVPIEGAPETRPMLDRSTRTPLRAVDGGLLIEAVAGKLGGGEG